MRIRIQPILLIALFGVFCRTSAWSQFKPTAGAPANGGSGKPKVETLAAKPPKAEILATKPPITGVADAAEIEFFEKKIRPALAQNCYSCHSHTAGKAFGGLYLDSRKALLSGGQHGAALLPGLPEKSLLLEAVRYTKPDLQMPPKTKLPDAVIADLAEWVKQGAPWPEDRIPGEMSAVEKRKRAHWAWQPVRIPPIPSVKHTGWAKSPIDRFLLAKLEEKGLTPSPYADRRTLIRRASFDLIGLPPTPEEVAAFEADTAPDAWPKLVDHLLASPHYGERWGRYWLDVARYGEDQAHSFEPRLYPQGFRYRDWVAHALNADMPYDRFLKEQIAADLLNEPDKQEQLPALGFFALGPVYYGDGKMFDQYDDRIDTLSRGVLGLTVACARCHDHKFDPISQKDYYALAGVISSSAYIEVPLASQDPDGKASNVAGVVDRNTKIKAKAAELDKFVNEQTTRIRSEQTPQIAHYLLTAWKLRNRQKSTPKTGVEAYAMAEGVEPVVLERWVEYLTAKTDPERSLLTDGRHLRDQEDPRTDLSNSEPAQAAARKVADGFQQAVLALIHRREATNTKSGAASGNPTPGQGPLTQPETAALEEIVGPQGVLTIPQEKLDRLLTGDSKLRFGILTAELNRLKMGFVHALTEGPKPSDLPVLLRGNPETPGAVEPRHFLSILAGENPPPFTQGSGRLELANAIADPHNPLTARVIVNRVWQHHFGIGIVRTTSNFGMLGEPPTHPELLDYLTGRFIAEGWSLKKLHREILLSTAYQMTSATNTHDAAVDPDDRLLWKMPRRRLEVEPWRDAMLAISGTLDPTVGGPSQSLASADNHRRTYYAAVSRHDLDAMLRLFDFPDPNATIDARMSTTVPLQQLFVLNSDFMVRQAKAFAARLTAVSGESDADRIRHAFRLAFSREPTYRELNLGLAFVQSPKSGTLTTTAATTQTPAHPPLLSRWEEYAQVLLSANEFMYID